MVRIRKDKGGCGIGPYWWPEDDPVCDVPEELARDLLGRPPEEGYSREPDPEPEHQDPDEPEGAGDGSPGEDGEGEQEAEAGSEQPPAQPAKAPARRSRAKGATA